MDFKALIEGQSRIVIQMHNFPDADTCSSAIAMEYLISKLNKTAKVDIIYFNRMNLSLDLEQMLETNGTKAIKIDETNIDAFLKRYKMNREEDLLIYVDCQKNAGNVFDLNFKNVVSFDHHADLHDEDYIYKHITPLGSCSILIYRYLLEYNINLTDSLIREVIYYGLMIDLDDFTKEMDYETNRLRKLLEVKGIDSRYISLLHSVKFPRNKIKDISTLIENSITDGNLFYSILYDSDDNLIGTLADFVLKFKGIDIVTICNERANTVKFSIRSREETVEAIGITGLFTNTGGQKIVGGVTIGGCTVNKTDILSKSEYPLKVTIYNEINKYIREQEKPYGTKLW